MRSDGLTVADAAHTELRVTSPDLSVRASDTTIPRPVDVTVDCEATELRFPVAVVYVASQVSDATYELENDTGPLDLPDAAYGGVICCGTFTHGHVGPECLPELLRVTRPGALFVCGTIAPVLDGLGFGSALAGLVAAGRITPVQFHDIPIYEGADHPHAADRGLVMQFHKI